MTKMSMRSATSPASGSERAMSRRTFLAAGAGTAAAAAAGTLFSPAGAFGDDSVSDLYGPSVNGELGEIVGSDLIRIRGYHLSLDWGSAGLPDQAGADVTVLVGEGATLYRDGVCELNAFEPGDRIIAFVHADGSQLVADAVEPTYELVEATVERRSGDRLDTSAGVVVLHDETSFRSTPDSAGPGSLDEISKGDKIEASCRLDESGDLVAAIIGVA